MTTTSGVKATLSGWRIPNKPSNLALHNFRSVNDKFGSLAKSARYTVRIFPPRFLGGDKLRDNGLFRDLSNDIAQDLLYLCEATEFPGRAFNTIDVRTYGPTNKFPTLSAYEDINMTFICRSFSLERRFFDDWMENINPSSTFDFNYKEDYSTIIELFQHTDYAGKDTGDADATYQFTLRDAYPVMINPQPVTWADDNIQKLTVTFTYSKWARINRDYVVDSKNVASPKRYVDWESESAIRL